ncbi:MAG: hypothetical protein U1F43_07870 [Myxococcota bacterium]
MFTRTDSTPKLTKPTATVSGLKVQTAIRCGGIVINLQYPTPPIRASDPGPRGWA